MTRKSHFKLGNAMRSLWGALLLSLALSAVPAVALGEGLNGLGEPGDIVETAPNTESPSGSAFDPSPAGSLGAPDGGEQNVSDDVSGGQDDTEDVNGGRDDADDVNGGQGATGAQLPDVAGNEQLATPEGNNDSAPTGEQFIEGKLSDAAQDGTDAEGAGASNEPTSPDHSLQATESLTSQDAALPQQEQLASVRQGRWLVTDAYGQGFQRYWIWSDTNQRAQSELITPANGAGYYAWATDQGYILRGKWDNGRGRVYVADNDGRLIGSDLPSDANGWVVSAAYDGHLERYYVDAVTRAACSGFFSVAGYGDAFGMGGHGYVVRSDFSFGGRLWSADNDGRLRSGWYVTQGFGQGMQRYWMGDTVYGSPHAAARSRLIDPAREASDYYAWATPQGYVLRGKMISGERVYLANNDGKLEDAGWLVTNRYDSGLQRYYINAATHAAETGFFMAELAGATGWFYAIPKAGYVMRGKRSASAGVLLADNDGSLAENTHTVGWMVTGAYDANRLERYFLKQTDGHLYAKTGFFLVSAKSYYGSPSQGYVMRNRRITYNRASCTADNEGALTYPNGSDVLVTNSWDGPRILMLGNSFTYYNNNLLSTTLTGLLDAEVVTSTRGGAQLSEHLNRKKDLGAQSLALLEAGGWDYVVIQELSTKPIDNYAGYSSDLAKLMNKAAAKGAVPVIYATWAFAGTGGETTSPGALARGISVQTMHQQLHNAFQQAAGSQASLATGAIMADVGSAFQANSFAGSLYDVDAKHPSAEGSSLAAQVIAETITRAWQAA